MFYTSSEQDSDGLDRYYYIEYRSAHVNVRCADPVKKVSFSNLKKVKHRGNSLVTVLGDFSDQNEYNDQQFLSEKKTKKVKVLYQSGNKKW